VSIPWPLPERMVLKATPKVLRGGGTLIALILIGLLILASSGPEPWTPLVILAVAAAFALAALRLMMLFGLWGGMKLYPDEFEFRRLFFRVRAKWTSCSEFTLIESLMAPAARCTTDDGRTIAVPDHYEFNREELTELLNRFRARAMGGVT